MIRWLVVIQMYIVMAYVMAEHTYSMSVYVSSRGLQYTNSEEFFESLIRQKGTPTVGHAWIRLIEKDDETVVQDIEGGHSGEFGLIAPQYFTRLLQESENPLVENPVQVLFQPLYDGRFEKGSGDNKPTYAATFDLTQEGFLSLCSLIDVSSGEYPFYKWSLTENNCVIFVLTCLGRIGIVLDARNVVQISPVTFIRGVPIKMWSDERYSQIEVATPDKLEVELKQLVALGIAREAIKPN